MIKKIMMKNVKGQNCTQELTGRDIFVGPNGSGKSTRIESVGISILGYVPGKGKKNEETFKLSTGNAMEVGICLEGHKIDRVTRTFSKKVSENKRTGAQKVSYSADLAVTPYPRDNNTIAAKEAYLKEIIGAFPVMFDFNEFLGLTDTERRTFFYNMSTGGKEWTREDVYDRLVKNLLTDTLRENNKERYDAFEDCINKTMAAFPENMDFKEGLTAAIEAVKENVSYWRKQRTIAEGSGKKLADIAAELEETDRGLAVNREELSRLNKKLAEVSGRISENREKIKANHKRLSDIEELEAKIKEHENSKQAIEKEIENFKKSKQTEYSSADIDAKRNEKKELQRKAEKLGSEIGELTTKQATIITKINQVSELAESLSAMSKTKLCAIDGKTECVNDFSNRIKELIVEKAELIEKQNEFSENASAKLIEKGDCSEKIEKVQAEIEKMESTTNYNRGIDLKIEAGTKNIEWYKKELASLTEKLNNLKAEKSEPVIEISMLEAQFHGTEREIEELEEKIQKQETAKTTLSNLQRSHIDAKVAEYNEAAYKLVHDEIGPKGIQGELVKGSLEPIEKKIQEKLDVMCIPETFYFSTETEGGREIFQFGLVNRKGVARNFDALSVGEKLLLVIALLVTMIEHVNPELKVLAIDEIQNLDQENFRKVLLGLSMIGGNLDNIILAGVVDMYCVEEEGFYGFKVHRLGDDR